MTGIIKSYAIITVLSFVGLWLATGSPILAGFFCGWIGLFTTIIVNEMTPGYTMENHGTGPGRR